MAACGSGTSGANLANGKTVFTQNCSGCHALDEAGSAASPTKAGPDLDDAFRGDRQQGFPRSEVVGLIKYWVQQAPQKPARLSPQGVPGKPAMPRDLVSGQNLEDVAAYVATVAGSSPASDVIPTPSTPSPAASTPSGGGTTPALPAGNAAVGKTVFATTCQGCHADLGHKAAVGPKLQGLGLTLARIVKQVEHGGAIMPAFGGTLSTTDIANVAAYVESIQK